MRWIIGLQTLPMIFRQRIARDGLSFDEFMELRVFLFLFLNHRIIGHERKRERERDEYHNYSII